MSVLLQVRDGTGEETTYLQLLDQVTTLARSLQHRGLVKGDIVSIICANSPEFPVMTLAVLLAGGIVNALSPLYTLCKSLQLVTRIYMVKPRILLSPS